MTIEELFGTLQQATVASWRKHLRTAKYAKHMALDEFYKELPEKVDALIEGYMGAHGKKIKSYENILKSSNMNTIKYLQELKKVCKEGYDLLDDNEELESLLDDIVNLINSTLYKVKELSESRMKDLAEFVLEALSDNETNESLVDEARTPSLSARMKKDIDFYINGMDKSDLIRKRDSWSEGKEYNNLMFNLAMNLFGSDSNPKYKQYKDLISDYAYTRIVNKVGVKESIDEAKKVELDFEDVLWAIEKCSDELKWYKELRHNSVDDVLEYYVIYDALVRELGVDEDTIRDFVADHEDELRERLEDL